MYLVINFYYGRVGGQAGGQAEGVGGRAGKRVGELENKTLSPAKLELGLSLVIFHLSLTVNNQ